MIPSSWCYGHCESQELDNRVPVDQDVVVPQPPAARLFLGQVSPFSSVHTVMLALFLPAESVIASGTCTSDQTDGDSLVVHVQMTLNVIVSSCV